jgi:hypothetical protein
MSYAYRYSLGIDLIEELVKLCGSGAQDFPASVFFAGKLIFQKERLLACVLHNHTPFTLQQKLQFEGMDMMVLPIRVFHEVRPLKPKEVVGTAV